MQVTESAWLVFHSDSPEQQAAVRGEVVKRAAGIPLKLDGINSSDLYWGELQILDAGNITHFDIGVYDPDALPGAVAKLSYGLPIFPSDKLPHPYPHATPELM